MSQRVRKFVRFSLWSLAGLLTVVLVAGLGLIARLASGPIEMSVPQSLLDRVVAEAAPGWHIEAGAAQLDFSSNDGLNGLKLHEVVLSDPDGNSVVRAPVLGLRFALSASLDPRKALNVREIALSGASVDVIRDENGVFQLEIGDISSASSTGGAPGNMPTSTGAPISNDSDPLGSLDALGNLGDLPNLRIEDARVRYSDLARGTVWRTENARLTLEPSAKGLKGTLGMLVDGGIGGAQLTAFHAAEDGEVAATLNLQGVRPSRVAELDPLLAPLARVDAPLSGTVEILATDGGAFRRVSGRITAANGAVTLTDQPVDLNSFSLAFSCDVVVDGCSIADLEIDSDPLKASARGIFRRSSPDTLSMALTIRHALGVFDGNQVTTGTASFAATLDANANVLRLDRAGFDAILLSGSQDGTGLALKNIATSGSFDLGANLLTLPKFAAEALSATDGAGNTETVARITGAASLDIPQQRLDLQNLNAVGVALALDDASMRIADIAGSASLDLASQKIVLGTTAASAVEIDLPGRKPASVERVSLSGTFDTAAQVLFGGSIQIKGALLPLPDVYAAPVKVSDATANIAVAHTDGVTRVSVKDAAANINGLTAKSHGNFAMRADGSMLGRIEASLGTVNLADLSKHWPKRVAPGGLRWVARNLRQGTSNAFTVKAQFDEARPDSDSLDLRFGFQDAVVTFVPGMPPIRGAGGKGHVTLDAFNLSLTEGGIAPTKGAPILKLKGSTFAITDFEPRIPDGRVQLRAKGDVRSVLRLLDTKPLGVISPTGFDIAGARGNADVRVLLDLPLASKLRVEDVQFDARAKIHKYSLKEPQTGAQVSGDVLLVKADADGLTLQSDARIDDIVARLGYSQGFKRPEVGQPDSILTLESFLTLSDFARHGLVLDDYLVGQTAMKTRIELFRGGAARINADADLTNLVLKVDQLGWKKPAGIPATLKLAGFRNPNGEGRIEAMTLRGEGISADGSIGFDARGQITRANLSRVILGSAIDIGVVYGRKTDGNVGILIKGAQVDLRKAFNDAVEGEPAPRKGGGQANAAAPAQDMDISMRIGRAVLRDDLAVFDLTGGIRLHGGDLQAANIQGKLNGSAATKLLAEKREGGMAIRLTAPDAGAFVRATNIFSGAYDGTLTLDARTRDTAGPTQISGRILVEDVVLHDAPMMRRILSSGAIASLLRDLSTGGIRFTKIELPFQGIGPEWQIENGVAFGPALGLTLAGTYDLSAGKLALDGSVSPAYAINGALGNVPLLGKLLTGGEGEGLFGVTFSVDGDSNKPVVNVNPLSALAPGFLRQIVAGVREGGSAPQRDGQPRFEAGGGN